MARIYTRAGDGGTSAIKDGRLPKSAPVFDVLGDLDELNSLLGTLPPNATLEKCQRALMALSSDVAGWGGFLPDALVLELEAEIDRLSSGDGFRLVPPRGQVHVARAVCRRAERKLVAFESSHAGLPFLNRLSDYLYALAEKR